MSRATIATTVSAMLVASLCGACSNSVAGHAAPQSAPIRSSAVKQLRGAELRYGASATAAAGIVYQPDVVVIGGGAAAVRAVSASGLTWTIDGNAPGANELAVGKIMLATSFGTGRVLSLSKSAGEDRMVLGPVPITDVILDGDIGSSTPIPISDTLAYTTPSAPGAAVDAAPRDGALVAEPAAFRSSAAPPPASGALPAPSSVPSTVGAGDFQVTPICCRQLGIKIGYNKNGGVLVATVKLDVGKPTVTFRLVISDGTLRAATFQVHGAGALSVTIDAATLNSAGSFAGKSVQVPETLTLPLYGFGVPLVLSLTQSFYLSMQLIGAASFHTNGAYKVSGDLGFGYRNGGPTLTATTLAAQDPFTANSDQVSVASGVITLGWSLKASIGIGLLGFSAGLWYALGTALSVTVDGLSLTAGCVRDALAVTGRYGVGYSISKLVAGVINLFLRVVNIRPIAASGGLSWGPTDLLHAPPADYCRK